MSEEEIVTKDLVKTFGSSVVALNDVSFSVKKEEFFAVIGPSGSGKTTLLKCLVGLERPDSGSIHIGGKNMMDVPIHERNMTLVFQNFGLFTSMNIFDNIAFGLSIRKFSEEKIKEQVNEYIRITGLEGLGNRMPKDLSIGQQQRVALARALIVKPNVVLYDEPLGNIDYGTQRKMLVEIKQIHRRVGFTSVYVTHDQEQAMVLANRIMIMNLGLIEQTGTPEEVYFNPSSIFVARFVGEINMLKGQIKKSRDDMAIVETGLGEFEAKIGERKIPAGTNVAYAIRPEKTLCDEEAKACNNRIESEVIESTYRGPSVHYEVKLPNDKLFKISLSGRVVENLKKTREKMLIGWNSEDAIILDRPSIAHHLDIDKALLGA